MINARQKFLHYSPLLLALLLLLAAVGVVSFPLPFTQQLLQQERSAIESTAEKIRSTDAKNQKTVKELSSLWEMRVMAMRQPEQTGTVLFRERIENAATKAGLRSRTMSNVRRIDLTENIMLFEVFFSADGNTSELVTFLSSLHSEVPRIYWRTLTITPEKEGTLTLSGSMCALSFVSLAQAAHTEGQP